jgi:3-oxoadipate enol-lactonase
MAYLKLSGGRFAYICQGRGTPVLLLHGLGSSLFDWQPQIDHLASFCQVYALDLRGHGLSEPLRAPTSMAALAADVAEFIQTMGIGPCILVGVSMGGMLTFQLLAEQPQLVRAAVLINTAPSFPVVGWRVRAQLWLRLAMVRWLGLERFGRVLAGRLFPKPEQQALRDLLAQRIAANDRRSYLHAMRAIPGWSALAAVRGLQTPLLVVAGDRDYTPVAYKQSYVEQLSNAELVVIADSGHATPLDQPEQLNQLLSDFVCKHAMSLPA